MRVLNAAFGGLLLVIFTAAVGWPLIGVFGVVAIIFTVLQSIKVVGSISQFFEPGPPPSRVTLVRQNPRPKHQAKDPAKKPAKSRHI